MTDRSKKDRKNRANYTAPTHVDRLPPHSPEAEQGVLGCIMLEPDGCLAECIEKIGRQDVFYDERHKVIYNIALKIRQKGIHNFDQTILFQNLKDANLLDMAGGMAYLSELLTNAASPANLPYHLQIVEEKYELRRMVRTATEVIDTVYGHTGGDLDELKYSLKGQWGEILGEEKSTADDVASWNDLLEFDTDKDPNCVIGVKDGKTTRFLCRGHGAWLIGPSGVGKSSLALLLAVAFAAGLPMWGIAPVKPLRVLVVQAENDIGDMSEMSKGIEDGLGVGPFADEKKAALIAQNIKVLSVTGKIGRDFCQWLRKKIIEHRADLVLVDPLLSFAGIDVSRQDKTSEFLRLWLDPVLRETGAVLLSVHHTGKPPTKQKNQGEPTIYDLAYAGIGSSELVNWARAIMLLQPAGQGTFRLILAKRGKRAWATHPTGEYTQILWLRHATQGIFWEQIDPPQEDEQDRKPQKEGRPSKIDRLMSLGLGGIVDDLKEPTGLNELARLIENYAGKNGIDVKTTVCKEAVSRLVTNGALKKEDGKYVKK
jgi:DnaB-like helicase N terminal domain/AAA domain